MRVEIVKKKEEKFKVKVGDIVCWTKDPEVPCLVSYKVLICLAEPGRTWSFDCRSHESFIKELEKMIIRGEIRKMDEVEKIIIYPD